jgi:acid phosphatase
MDLDETVLDNSPFAGRMVRDRVPFDQRLWSEWVSRAEAGALPGSLEFIRRALDRGVAVFYVTNRSADQEAATRANLERLGLALPAGTDTVLMSRERPEWRSDKGPRRAHVAATHRILLLLGDDLGDFVSGAQDTPENRVALAGRHDDKWGMRWFLIPNPMNGSWEMSLYEGFPPDDEVLRSKLARVKSFP